jgi:voltage-gated potassium channel
MDRKIRNSFWILGSILFLVIITGAIFVKISENLSWIDAFYSTVLLLSTAGTGNIHPTITASKIFVIVFLLIGVPLVLFCLGYIIEEFFKMRLKTISIKMDEVIKEENKILKEEDKILSKEKELSKK